MSEQTLKQLISSAIHYALREDDILNISQKIDAELLSCLDLEFGIQNKSGKAVIRASFGDFEDVEFDLAEIMMQFVQQMHGSEMHGFLQIADQFDDFSKLLRIAYRNRCYSIPAGA